MTSSIQPASRQPDDRRSADWITDQIAMQQEMETLRHALSVKSSKLDAITKAFGTLEDRLEDQHQAYDVLRKKYRRKKRALRAVRRKLIQTHDRSLEEHSGAAPDTGVASNAPTDAGTGTGDFELKPASPSVPFLWGLTAGTCLALLIAGAGMFWWHAEWSRQIAGGSPPLPLASSAEPDLVSVEVDAAAERNDEAEAEADPSLIKPRTLRDRFRDGASGPLMAVLPPGKLTMGARGLMPEYGEHPVHRVRISGFLIGVNEVTFAEYDRFVRATGRRVPDDFGWGRGRHPVVDVSWTDALAYTRWLSGQTGKRYRLPTEAEWEYAARAGTRTPHWWGYEVEQGKAACFDCGSTWDNRSTAPTGNFASNPFHLNDTAGNAMEWVQDCYHPSYDGAPADGQAWESGPCTERVARGGAFNKPSKSLRSSARHRLAPDTRINMIGFRLARDL